MRQAAAPSGADIADQAARVLSERLTGGTLCQNSLDTYVHFTVRRSHRGGIGPRVYSCEGVIATPSKSWPWALIHLSGRQALPARTSPVDTTIAWSRGDKTGF